MGIMKVRSKTDQNLINHYNDNDDDDDDDDGDNCERKVNAANLHYVALYEIIPMHVFSFLRGLGEK